MAVVVFALSTIRSPRGRDASSLEESQNLGPAEVVARAGRLGIAAVALDAWLDAGALETLLPAVLSAGLSVACVEAPCPRPVGGRPPYLASSDPEERLAATRAFEATLETASRVGATRIAVQLGVLDVKHAWPTTVRAYAQRTLDDDDLEKLVVLRRALSPHALDLARFALDAILDRAADAGVTVGLVNRARWFEIASAAEVDILLADFRGGPLATFYDAAAAHVRAALGLGTGRPALELEAASAAFLSDAAGLRGGLPWGTGEVDRAHVLAKLPEGAPRILRSAIATDEEIRNALSQS
jgi:sugar phosphate isomerase/epimerase